MVLGDEVSSTEFVGAEMGSDAASFEAMSRSKKSCYVLWKKRGAGWKYSRKKAPVWLRGGLCWEKDHVIYSFKLDFPERIFGHVFKARGE